MVVTPPTPAGLLRVEHAVAAALVEDAPLEDVLSGRHCGGATAGGGLRGTEDRPAAVGGRLKVHSPRGSGTIVRG